MVRSDVNHYSSMLGVTIYEARIVIRIVIWSKSEMSRLFLMSNI